jgi:hypothetical protein
MIHPKANSKANSKANPKADFASLLSPAMCLLRGGASSGWFGNQANGCFGSLRSQGQAPRAHP